MKKTLAISLVLAIICTLCSFAAFAATVDVADAAALQTAIDNSAAGDVIRLTAPISVSEITFTVGAGKDVIIDLNGNTITGTTALENASFALIKITNGTLTVRDSVGTGKITLNYTGASSGSQLWGDYTVSIEGGTLNLESGTIENTTPALPGHMYSAVDVNSGSASAYFYMTGGKLICTTYVAFRQFANSTTNENVVEIKNDSEVTGIIFVQSPNSNTNKATLDIEDGTISKNDTKSSVLYVSFESSDTSSLSIDVSGGDFTGDIAVYGNVDPFISGGSFSEDVSDHVTSGNVAAVAAGGNNGYKVMDEDDVAAVAADDDGAGNPINIVAYESVDDALASGKDEVSIVGNNLQDGTTLNVPSGVEVTVVDINDPNNNTTLLPGSYNVSVPVSGTTGVPTITPAPAAPANPPAPSARPNPSTGVR